MIGNSEQASTSAGKCEYVGHADVFISTSGDLVLRSHFLSEKLKQNELYFISKDNCTQSIILTLVEKILHLDPIDNAGYICMDRKYSNYVNLEEEQKNVNVIQSSASTSGELTAEAHQNVNSSNNNQDESAPPYLIIYEDIDDIAIKSNKSKIRTSLQNVITSLLSCCACCVRTG